MWSRVRDNYEAEENRLQKERKDENDFQEALKLTKGIKNHFWLEKEFIDNEGQRQELTDQGKDELLKKLTKITNLTQVEREWPLVDWRDMIKKTDNP